MCCGVASTLFCSLLRKRRSKGVAKWENSKYPSKKYSLMLLTGMRSVETLFRTAGCGRVLSEVIANVRRGLSWRKKEVVQEDTSQPYCTVNNLT